MPKNISLALSASVIHHFNHILLSPGLMFKNDYDFPAIASFSVQKANSLSPCLNDEGIQYCFDVFGMIPNLRFPKNVIIFN